MTTEELIIERFIPDMTSLPYRATKGTREELAALFGELGFKVGAEIGVRVGKYSVRLCRNIPGLKLKCVDPWVGFRKTSDRKAEGWMQQAQNLLEPYGAELIRKTGVDAAKDVEDGSLDFVYIDAMHEFDSVIVDIISWHDKVRAGGIVSGHDYILPTWYNGVKLAVESFTQAHGIDKWYITSEEHDGYIAPSWFWVR